ncbi:3-deoxy-7-phosphoheptulonate synthase [Marinomonas posidonica]|uniref:Phospho-2-dehydro-3-deoxyheptonate aldolase n=1 Tax=Marinomonas posidonica (strain CECT 7376 / NCIMB 14433 / IVIA-Po-181) TaxID=491952 RepID=F6CZE2_MARPP|nr:3-deoxy-7-phosphoheptulonate synthase [Marinomonas posidonica]AEF54679.1 phospho-2-dehydro-3-deoxyheptonate aldolase [Marinomonas posidonica IVIA-Po-181]
MSNKRLEDLNIASFDSLVTPSELKQALPISDTVSNHVAESRDTIKNIMDGKDHRLAIVIGPCSIHDTDAALDYAKRLKALSEKLDDSLFIIMRAYFEKPRTTVGWKGLINDPNLDGTFDIDKGIRIGRKLLIDLAELGLPLATEALDPISPQYIQDLISWSAIGARTTESQTHREMASGLSGPVGFKNGTDGSMTVAVNAMQSVSHGHSFLGINENGQVSIVNTKGNAYGHLVLRGGNGKPNYDAANIALSEAALTKANLKHNIMVDCSHENSNKQPERQITVMEDSTQQILAGNQSIMGLMIESNIGWGNQKVPADISNLEYGVSITDACIDWEATEKALTQMANELRSALPKRQRD